MKNISLLGATGSIGMQTCQVVRAHKDKFKIAAISFNKNWDDAKKIIDEFNPMYVCITDMHTFTTYKDQINATVVFGKEGLEEICALDEVNIVLNGISGFAGLASTIAAIKAKKDVALANKESLVVAGEIIMPLAKENGVNIIPVDSEHSAIFQALGNNKLKDIKKIILTASGGALRDWDKKDLPNAKVSDVLKHPNWDMGKKITVDSATLMNKALEVIEARWLFDTLDIEVLIHRQSIVHSMVEFKDNSTIAQLGVPSMILPIQYGLSYPERIDAVEESIDWTKTNDLTFEVCTNEAIDLAVEAMTKGGTMPTVLNAANEVAVEAFLNEKIKFTKIVELVKDQLSKHENILNPTLEDIFEVDKKVREGMVILWLEF